MAFLSDQSSSNATVRSMTSLLRAHGLTAELSLHLPTGRPGAAWRPGGARATRPCTGRVVVGRQVSVDRQAHVRQSNDKLFNVQHMGRDRLVSNGTYKVESTKRSIVRSQVPLHVQRQVVAAREGPLAQLALEGPVAGVLAVVTGELVGAGEFPAASLPATQVRLLPGVRAVVRLQVRALRVRLVAARVAARVVHLPLAAPGASPALPRRLQVAAVGRLQGQQKVHEVW